MITTTDWAALPLGADLSHYQGRPDFGALVADGVAFVILKATQGMNVDPDFDWNRNEAERRGMPWAGYVYLESGDTAAGRTKIFTSILGTGAVPALDWEQSGVSAVIVETWMNDCEDTLGRPGLAYYGRWPPFPVTSRITRWCRWFPEYPDKLESGPALPPWDGLPITDWSDRWLLWQYTGNGKLPGVNTEIDLNRLACSLDTFKAWVATGTLPVQGSVVQSVPSNATLYLHCSGNSVTLLQRLLLTLGYHISVDGQYGPQTRIAVIGFQTAQGLTADGIAGPQTIAALNKGI